MRSGRVKAVVAAVLMLFTFVGAQAWRPTVHIADSRPKVDLERLFPTSFGDWTLDRSMPVQLVSPDLQAALNAIYNQTLSRTYINAAGERVMLSVAYGGDQSDGSRAHLPEVCYPAQGFQILSKQATTLSMGGSPLPAVHLVAKLGGRVEPITYWVVVGDKIALTYYDQKFAQIGYGVRGLIPDGMLVRVSTIDTDPARAYRLQTGFISDLLQAIPEQKRAVIVGAGH